MLHTAASQKLATGCLNAYWRARARVARTEGLPALGSVDGSLQGSLEWLLQTADGKLCGSFRSPLRRSALDELYTSDGQWPMSEECLSFLDGYLAIMVAMMITLHDKAMLEPS